ncbi:MAG: hypothetical protein AB1649_17855 [Chloroflexota bacterium]
MPDEIKLIKDSDWAFVDNEVCRVKSFTPLCSIVEGRIVQSVGSMPYASMVLESIKTDKPMTGYVVHKIDLQHLLAALNEQKKENDQFEVLIIWTKTRYVNIVYKLLAAFMPRMIVMLCKKGAFEVMHDVAHRPELKGMDRMNAMLPVREWRPAVIEA